MKKILLAITLVLMISLVGCENSTAENELENRVDILEEQVENLQETNDELNDTLGLYDSYFNLMLCLKNNYQMRNYGKKDLKVWILVSKWN